MNLADMNFLIAMTCWVNFSSGRENGRLFYYETMSKISETTRAKRSSPPSARLVKELYFRAFRRDFHLSLTSGSSVLAEGFQARMIHGDGSSTRFTVDQSKLFTGRVVHSKQSMVSAFLERGLWNIHIFEQGEAFAVEPSWRLLARVDNPHNDTMVTYRLSDVKDLPHNYRFCSVPPDINKTSLSEPPVWKKPGTVMPQYVNNWRSSPARQKRNVKNTCRIQLVGDAALFEIRCRRNHNYCASMMIQFLQITDDVYRNSKFEDKEGNHNTGFGLQVRALQLHVDYANRRDMSLGRHFNDRGHYDADQKLKSFSHYMYKSQFKFCLHHLFTEFEDPGGILGRAYDSGLCGLQNLKKQAFNTGVSSGTTSAGTLVPSLMASIVLTHEISHNYGSTHDPDTFECAPGDKNGGKYIMWQFAVQGNRRNNKVLSKCSLRQIGRKVPAWCFVERTKQSQFCGNGLVEGDEKCDAGTRGLLNYDECCTNDCNLRDGANCSDSNQECCRRCQIAPKGTQCWGSGYSYSCKTDSECTGDTLDCPEGKMKPDNESCGPQHLCSGGECLGPCQQETKRVDNGTILKPCRCTGNTSELCMYCCFDATRETEPGECRPISPELKPNGSQCQSGICRRGSCDQTPVLSAAILENYIRQFAQITDVRTFMASNVVLVVVLLTLLLWVPTSLIISHVDKKGSEDEKSLFEQELDELRKRHASKAKLLSHSRLVEQGLVDTASGSVLDQGHVHRPGHPTSLASIGV